MIESWLFEHPEVLGYLMMWCVVLIVLSANWALDDLDDWVKARRYVAADDEITSGLTPNASRQLARFVRHNVTVSTFGDRRRRTPAIFETPRDTAGLQLDDAAAS